MNLRKLLPFFLQGTAAGIVIGFTIYLVTTTDLLKPTQIIEFKETTRSEEHTSELQSH